MKSQNSWRKYLVSVCMFFIGILFILPFVWMLSTSLKVDTDVFNYPIEWIPKRWHAIENYKEVWFGDHPFWIYYLNTIFVSGATTVLSCIVSAMAAYGFSKVNFPAGKWLFLIVLATYMIPQQSILVPQFIMYRMLGLFDTRIGLVLLTSFSVLGVFMLRQFFIAIHNDYIESAKIDGANHFTIFMYIAFPLIKPAVATYAILRFIWTWNDYQNPLIFLRSDSLLTLQVALQKFTSISGEYYSLIMAGAVSGIVPLLIVFIIGQKSVIEGISMGGIKG